MKIISMLSFIPFIVIACLGMEVDRNPDNTQNYWFRKRKFNAISGSTKRTFLASKKTKIMTNEDSNSFRRSLRENNIDKAIVMFDTFDIDLNEPYYQKSHLHIAISKGHSDIVKLLVERNAECSTCLQGEFYASLNRVRSGIAAYLVEHFLINVDRPIDPKSLKTPLHIAFEKKSISLIKMLMEKFEAEQRYDRQGFLPIAYLAKADVALKCVQDILDYLFGKKGTIKIDIKVSNETDSTLLHEAVRNGNLPLIQTLIKEYYAPLGSVDYDGKTPLLLARQLGKQEIVEYLEGQEL